MKKIFNFQFSIFNSRGFTLLELIIVFAIISIMTTLGIAAFVDYNRDQTLNTAALDLVTTLNLAKFRAQSQVKPDACTGTLDGYKVGICNLDSLKCSAETDTIKTKYAFYAVCSNESFVSFANTNKTLPTGIDFVPLGTGQSDTTTTSILFRVLTGGVSGSGRIVLSGFNKTKIVTIDSSGNIDSN